MRWLRLLISPVALVAVGLGISSLAGTGFLAIVNRGVSQGSVTPDEFVALSAMYFLLATIGTGMLAGLEQELTRALSAARATGRDTGEVIRAQLRHGRLIGVGTLVAVALASPLLVTHYLHDHWYLAAELLIGLAATWACYLVRGTLTGNQFFGGYSASLTAEGGSRLISSALLLVAGVATASWFGLSFALGPAFAALTGYAALWWLRRRRPPQAVTTPPAPLAAALDTAEDTAGDRANLTRLTGANLASQVLLNLTPLLITMRFGGITALAPTVGAIASAIGLTRLGLLLMFPLQTPLLPKLVAAVHRGDLAEFRRLIGMLLGFSVLAGCAGIAFLGLLGPWLLRTVMGAQQTLPAGLMAVLGLGTLLLMLGYLLQSALLALSEHRNVLIGWLAGVLASTVLFVVPTGVVLTAGLAATVGPAVAVAVLAMFTWRAATTPGRWQPEHRPLPEPITGDPARR